MFVLTINEEAGQNSEFICFKVNAAIEKPTLENAKSQLLHKFNKLWFHFKTIVEWVVKTFLQFLFAK
jgi:hypothetical protein